MSARSAFSSLVFSLVVAACAPPANQAPAAAPVDSAAVTAGVADLWQRRVAANTSGNAAALAELVGDSARLDMRGAPPMMGRDALRAFAEAVYRTTKYGSMTITSDMTIPVSNELVYQTGNYTEVATAGGTSNRDHGRYASAVRKDADGQWRVAYLMAFADSTVPVKK